ncbi:MAG: hypothetical protein ACXWPM_08505 [Bdellovibrionota bacterium]
MHKNVALVIIGLLGSSLAFAEDAVRFDCPSEIHVRAEFGSLRISDATDQDFAVLSNSTLESDFVRLNSQDGCVFVQEGPAANTLKRQFMEVRHQKTGETSVILEGYTQASSKLYSIRVRTGSVETLNGAFEGLVFDGSGPNRSKLGDARLAIEVLPSR